MECGLVHLNVPGIVGLGKACELCRLEMESEATRLSAMRDRLQASLLQLEESYVNGNVWHRLPHVANISFKYVEGEGLMMAMKDLGCIIWLCLYLGIFRTFLRVKKPWFV